MHRMTTQQRKMLGLCAGLAAIGMAGAAQGQTLADDARCLIVSSTYARSASDSAAHQVAQATAAFFLGRVDGRSSAAALKAELAAQQKLITPANAPATMKACSARVGAAEQRVRAAAPPMPQPPKRPMQPGR